MSTDKPREYWGSKIGLILAVAGNAVGLGNFLRFPVQAVENGGGAFMIPYFFFFLVVGIPLMWMEWGIGRYGGKYGHGSAPGMFDVIWKSKFAKYFGTLGLLISTIILIYYTYIESWTLGYSFLTLTKDYFGAGSFETMGTYLRNYQGIGDLGFSTSNFGLTYFFFVLTFALNFWVLYRGISQGIEKLAKIAMPLLIIFAIILAIRVLTLGTPNPAYPDRNVTSGLAFFWNPDFSSLAKPSVWLAAAGQIFFTLSLGMGSIQAYASYLKPKDDIALSGLTTASTNEFAEVVLGGSIAIPAAVAFFGVTMATQIANSGAFNLGFVSMPLIFEQIPFGNFFGFLWFFLLFFAGITSSVAMSQPVIAFLEDELGFSRKKAVTLVGVIVLVATHLVVFFLKYGVLDEMDYWAGTFGLVVFALIESILFMWVFGGEKAWEEMNMGGDIKIPRFFYYIMRYITPLVLLVLMLWWFVYDALPILIMENIPTENIPYIWGSRILMLSIGAVFFFIVHIAWKKRKTKGINL